MECASKNKGSVLSQPTTETHITITTACEHTNTNAHKRDTQPTTAHPTPHLAWSATVCMRAYVPAGFSAEVSTVAKTEPTVMVVLGPPTSDLITPRAVLSISIITLSVSTVTSTSSTSTQSPTSARAREAPVATYARGVSVHAKKSEQAKIIKGCGERGAVRKKIVWPQVNIQHEGKPETPNIVRASHFHSRSDDSFALHCNTTYSSYIRRYRPK